MLTGQSCESPPVLWFLSSKTWYSCFVLFFMYFVLVMQNGTSHYCLTTSALVILACSVPVLLLLPAVPKTGRSCQWLKLPTGVNAAAGTQRNKTQLVLGQSEATNRDPPCANELRVMVCKLMRKKRAEEHRKYLIKPHFNPQTGLWGCVDQQKCPQCVACTRTHTRIHTLHQYLKCYK